MKLQWDEAKRLLALQERGLDFADVAKVDWEQAVTRRDTRSDYGEERFVSVAVIRGRLCVIVWCERGDALRVISMRKANRREEKAYERAQKLY